MHDEASEQPESLQEVIDGVCQLGAEQERVALGDVQRKIGARSYGPFLFVPAVLEISPLGGIPGVPTLLALVIGISAAQMLVGRERFWMPQVLAHRTVKGDKLVHGLGKIRPALGWIDKLLKPRLHWATTRAFVRLVAVASLLLVFTVPPLEFVPFASSAPMAAIALFGLGLTAKDGLVILLGLLAAIAAVVVGTMGLMGG